MPTGTSNQPDPLTLKAALDGKREMIARMPASEVIATPGLDLSAATGIVIGSLPRIAKLRDAIAEEFGDEAADLVDELPAVAFAAEQANIELAAADAATDLSSMNDDLAEEHTLLLTDADSLANRKLVERARVDAGRPVLGYRTIVTSTLVLVSLFRELWDAVAGKTPVTVADLDRIEMKAQGMLSRMKEREQGTTRQPALDLRMRAISLLIRHYSQVRRMIAFVRWEHDEDVDAIAPSLWSGRRGKSRVEVEPALPVPTDPVAPVVVPVPAGPNNGGAPFTS